jgi:hypothetical protein
MTIAKMALMLVCLLMSFPLEPQDAKVTPLLSKDLMDLPGKEGLMITVESAAVWDSIVRKAFGLKARELKQLDF